MFKTSKALSVLFCFSAIALLSGCDAVRESDSKRFPRLSATRPLGSPIGPKDSASVKRIQVKQLSEGDESWHQTGENFVRYERTKATDKNELCTFRGNVTGYLQFDKPGYLWVRNYDDVYGDIYCGWAPKKLELKPTKDHVLVSLTKCSSKRPNEVTEVGWFPDGAEDGVLLFSSVYEPRKVPYTAAELYDLTQFHNGKAFYNADVLAPVVMEDLKKGDLVNARKVINDAQDALATVSDAVDGTTHRIIKARENNENDWLRTYFFELGLGLGDKDYDESLKNVYSVVGGPHFRRDYVLNDFESISPLFKWLNEQVKGKNVPVPDDSALRRKSTWGREPHVVARILRTDGAEESKAIERCGENGLFWAGAKAYVRKDYVKANKLLSHFLEEQTSDLSDFELAAAAKLKSKINPSPEAKGSK